MATNTTENIPKDLPYLLQCSPSCLFSICRLEDEEEKEENGEKEEKDTVYANINQLQKFARDITVPAVFKGKLIYGVHVVVSCLYFFGKMAKLKLLFNSFLLNVQ